MTRPILLDTCALLWIADGAGLAEPAVAALADLETTGGAPFVSPISAWEIGLLVARGRMARSRDPLSWFNDLIADDLELALLAPATLIASSCLHACDLRDPADRILVATARTMNLRLMTRDRRILAYAAEGHLAAIDC